MSNQKPSLSHSAAGHKSCLKSRAMSSALLVFLAATPAANATAPKLHVLLSFAANGYPKGNLLLGKGGVFFGTSSGIINGGVGKYGTIFELIPPAAGQAKWTKIVLHKFTGGTDGYNPQVGVISDHSGALYGTTYPGFDRKRAYPALVYRLTPPASGQTEWSYTALAEVSMNGYPGGQLLRASDGTLYGTATETSQNGCFCGSVFSVTPPKSGKQWTFNQLYQFEGGSDGESPESGLIADASGALYGTTALGGDANVGTVFKLTPPGNGQTQWTETQLFAFQGGLPDGSMPVGNLAWSGNGTLYGTTSLGGANGGGTVFELSPPANGGDIWTETQLASFPSPSGTSPQAGILIGSSGVLFGTVALAGKHGGGVYALHPPSDGGTMWNLHNLHSFGSGREAPREPLGGVIGGPDNLLYGTTTYGGAYGQGTIFSITR